jgi:hypothetical protein
MWDPGEGWGDRVETPVENFVDKSVEMGWGR